MIRSWGVQTLTGAAQPWFGDVLTAAFSPVGDGGPQKVTVASTTLYAVGDRVIIGIGQANPNILLVDRIFSATVLYCHSEGGAPIKAWANSTIIALDIACADVILQQFTSDANPVWIGSDSTVTNAGAGSAFAQILPGAIPYHLNQAPQWNVMRTTDGWMAGTIGDKTGVAALVV